METRNLKYNRDGTIDMDINHPKLGWIPFTASPDDSEQYGRELYQQAIDGQLGNIEPADIKYLAEYQEEYKQNLKGIRIKKRNEGLLTQGYTFYTDKESVADLFMAVQGHLAQGGQPSDPAPNWKTMDGYTSGLAYADLQTALQQIGAFVQSAYDAEAQVLNEINALTEQDKDTFEVQLSFSNNWPR